MVCRILFCFLLMSTVSSDETYEKSSDLCESRCLCKTTDTTQEIDCHGRGLQNMIANWPKSDKNVLQVSFKDNYMTTLESLPPTDAEVEVTFENCQIQYITSGVFGNVLSIKMVDFSHNLLTSEELSSDKFKGPYNPDNQLEPLALEHLDLSFNRIHSLNKNVFEHMPNLTRLSLEGNSIGVLDVHTQLAISSVTKLQVLNLANNGLTELEREAIGNLRELNELNLSKNQLDFVPDSLTYIGDSLRILNIDSNPIMEVIADSFLGLVNVEDLSMNNLTRLKFINANSFVSMPKLKKLSLSNNQLLIDIDREAFRLNNTLEVFYLNNNSLYKLDYSLLEWGNLKTFEFKENPFKCSCDLYNITQKLTDDVKRNLEMSPTCINPQTDQSEVVYYLKSDICEIQAHMRQTRREIMIRYHYRIPVILLFVVLSSAIVTAMFLSFNKYRRFLRSRHYPYVSEVLYNPLTTNGKF